MHAAIDMPICTSLNNHNSHAGVALPRTHGIVCHVGRLDRHYIQRDWVRMAARQLLLHCSIQPLPEWSDQEALERSIQQDATDRNVNGGCCMVHTVSQVWTGLAVVRMQRSPQEPGVRVDLSGSWGCSWLRAVAANGVVIGMGMCV